MDTSWEAFSLLVKWCWGPRFESQPAQLVGANWTQKKALRISAWWPLPLCSKSLCGLGPTVHRGCIYLHYVEQHFYLLSAWFPRKKKKRLLHHQESYHINYCKLQFLPGQKLTCTSIKWTCVWIELEEWRVSPCFCYIDGSSTCLYLWWFALIQALLGWHTYTTSHVQIIHLTSESQR